MQVTTVANMAQPMFQLVPLLQRIANVFVKEDTLAPPVSVNLGHQTDGTVEIIMATERTTVTVNT